MTAIEYIQEKSFEHKIKRDDLFWAKMQAMTTLIESMSELLEVTTDVLLTTRATMTDTQAAHMQALLHEKVVAYQENQKQKAERRDYYAAQKKRIDNAKPATMQFT